MNLAEMKDPTGKNEKMNLAERKNPTGKDESC